MSRVFALVFVCLWSYPALGAVAIEHREVGCIAAGKFPRFAASFEPVADVARARVLFRAEGSPHWYSVPMRKEGGEFRGVLPKPKSSLARMSYYISVTDREFGESRTAEARPIVVSGPGACQQSMVLAPALGTAAQVVVSAPEGVLGAPLVPAGFSTDGVAAAMSTGSSGTAAASAAGASATGAGATGGAAASGAAVGASAAGGGLSTTVLVVGGVAIAGGAAAVAVTKAQGEESGVSIEGRVFRSGTPNGPPGAPIAGAVVGTSLSSQTATSDGAGHFFLDTGVRGNRYGSEPYTVTVNAAGCQGYSVTRSWGNAPRDQTLTLTCP